MLLRGVATKDVKIMWPAVAVVGPGQAMVGTFFSQIKFKISALVIGLLLLATLAFYLLTTRLVDDHIAGEIVKRAESLTRSIAASAGYNILSRDFLGLDNMVFKMRESNPDVEGIAVVNNAMKVLAHSDAEQVGRRLSAAQGRVIKKSPDGTRVVETAADEAGVIEIVSPVHALNRRLGFVVLRVNRSVLYEARRTMRTMILGVFAAILAAGIAGSIALSAFLTKPIKELSDGVEELGRGKADRRLKVYSQDELGKLTERFNEMTALITDQRGKLTEFARELEESYVSTVRVLAAAIDARDPYTHGHSARVSRYSVLLGSAAGLSKRDLDDLEVACLFHDIGKIRTPDSILRKKERLDAGEYREMMRHPEDGAAILSNAPSLHKYILPVKHHHERFDGGGYPDGLKGDQIPFFSAIMAVTDTYDAMTTKRPYRDARSIEETIDELLRCSEKQFHPDLVAAFLRVLDKVAQESLPEPR